MANFRSDHSGFACPSTVHGVTIRLTVRRADWLAHVHGVADVTPGLVPVVKGNGYGFRRWNLMEIAGELSREVAVGTVFEVRDTPSHITPIVLTPTMTAPPKNLPMNTVLTVGSPHHVVALTRAQWRGDVIVKLQSSTKRFGVAHANLQPLLSDIALAQFTIRGFAIHPPIAGDMAMHLADITQWLDHIDPLMPVYISHLDSAAYAALRRDYPTREFRMRLGTSLWHGDKSTMHLSADIVDHHPVESGSFAGYTQVPIKGPGEIVIVGCGTAHGVVPLLDGRSPFHFQRQRMNMLEPSHMHTSMLFIARGRPIPSVGEWIDVQQPLTRVQVDLLQWV